MTMLGEEIKRLLSNIENELLEFVKYVETIEEEYNKFLPQDEQIFSELDQRQTSRNRSEDANDFSNNSGIPDAIEIAKMVLKRIYNLLDRFFNLITINERNLSFSPSYLEKYFYDQYVCQIVAYLLKILEENLSMFSEELIGYGETKLYDVPGKSDGKKPMALKFQFFKPATLFTEDGKIYESARSKKHRLQKKSPSNHRESCRSRTECKETSSEEDKCNHYKCHECCEKENRKNMILNNVLKSLHTLVTIVEEILVNFRNCADAGTFKKQSSPPLLAASDTTKNHEAKHQQKDDYYALGEYIKFCESCKALLKNSQYINVEVYKAHPKENLSWNKTHTPKIKDDMDLPFEDNKKYLHTHSCIGKKRFSHSTERISHLKESVSPTKHKEKILDQGVQNYLAEDVSNDHDLQTKEEDILSSSKNNQNLPSKLNTPVQKIKEESIEKKNNISPGELKSSNLMKRLEKDSIDESISLTEHHVKKTHVCTGQPLKATKGTSTNPEETDLSSNAENRDVEVNVEDRAYPETVVFDVKKFSHLLKEKVERTGRRCESKQLLDIVVTSFQESSDFKFEGVTRNIARSSSFKESLDTTSDLETEADKAVDSLVDGVINIAAQIAQIKRDCLHEKSDSSNIQEKEQEQIDRSPDDIGELFSEPAGLNKKLQSITQACISCLNMKEFIRTNLEKKASHTTLVGATRSLTNACFNCWNGCQRGLTIHQCHSLLPSGVYEIRHMDNSGRINVCFLKLDLSKETDDWRWQKNQFPDSTRVEIQQSATHERDPVFQVVYGPEGTMVKESFGETRLRTICDFPDVLHNTAWKQSGFGKIVKSDSMTTFRGQKIMRKFGLRYKKQNYIKDIEGSEFQLFSKLCRFYDDVQKFGYGRGPPLVLKLRKNYILNDAYDLLMAPSQIRLHYYRNLRAIFISDDNCNRQVISKTNYAEEDQSYELFDIFARRLFGSEAFHLFEYPSEEAHYMYLNPDTHTHPQWFVFAGTVMALAFLHQKQISIKISSCLFKCLLDRPLVIGDLQSVDPLLYQKLMWLKDNDITQRKRKMTFVIHDKVGFKTIDHELMLNGRKLAVTEKNKYRYIELAVKWKLAERCLTQLKDFRRGFASVVDPCFLSTFTEHELLTILKHPPNFEVFMPESSSGSRDISRRGTW